MLSKIAKAVSCLFFSLILTETCLGGFVVTATEEYGNVVFSGSGSFNVDGLSFRPGPVGSGLASGIWAREGLISFNGTLPIRGVQLLDVYRGEISGPDSFGTGGLVFPADVRGGDWHYLWAGGDTIILPVGYTSGTELSGVMEFHSQTFETLGMTPGEYVWTWGSGGNHGSYTLRVGESYAIPEPSSIALLWPIAVALGFFRRRLSRARAASLSATL
jgi:hypothetical protein